MNKMVRNTYSNDLVLERLKREREKTIKAESKKPKGSLPFWLQALLGSQAVFFALFAAAVVCAIIGALSCWYAAFEYISWSLEVIY